MYGPYTIVLRAFEPADADWLVESHGAHYAASDGFDATFPALVRDIVEDFLANAAPPLDRGWIAASGPQRLGSIFCVGGGATGVARLRLFYVAPEARGTGLGARLLTACLDHARGQGCHRMTLWTHESHRAAGRLYKGFGFALKSARPTRSFGADVVEQHWEIALRGEGRAG
ncbi:MAG: GNAT family N-acetyltransferase [Paracoccaceae bacterium]|nr:GNAT family N-acetyltransferase [Paracoccaceae bacterium]